MAFDLINPIEYKTYRAFAIKNIVIKLDYSVNVSFLTFYLKQ